MEKAFCENMFIIPSAIKVRCLVASFKKALYKVELSGWTDGTALFKVDCFFSGLLFKLKVEVYLSACYRSIDRYWQTWGNAKIQLLAGRVG